MNIKYGDSNLTVRYLEAFLQEEYNNTLRVSGIYDTYTHNNLIEYINLPKVASSEEMYDALLSQYSQIPIVINGVTEYKSITYCFAIVRTVNTITCSSKSVNKPDDLVEQAMRYIMDANTQPSLLEFAKEYGWDLTTFISYVDTNSTDEYRIVLTQSTRKNLIPLDTCSLVNLSTEDFMFNSKIEGNVISTDASYCTMIIPCKPNTEYVICHRFDNEDGNGDQLPVTFYVGSTNQTFPNQLNNSVSSIEEKSVVRGTCVTYKTSSKANNILLSYEYDEYAYNNSFLILKKNNLSDTDIDTDEFIESYWLVHTKFFDYLFGSSISELSDESDIYNVQKLLANILPRRGVETSGIYTEDFRQIVKEYQELYKSPRYLDRRPKMFYSLGYIDVQTEGQILKDTENGVQLYY